MLSSLIKYEISVDMCSIQEGEEEGRIFITKSPELLREAYVYLHSQGIVFYSGVTIPEKIEEYLDKGDNGLRLVRSGREVRVLRVCRDPHSSEKFVEITRENFKVKRGEKL